jgi:hypothetical protein
MAKELLAIISVLLLAEADTTCFSPDRSGLSIRFLLHEVSLIYLRTAQPCANFKSEVGSRVKLKHHPERSGLMQVVSRPLAEIRVRFLQVALKSSDTKATPGRRTPKRGRFHEFISLRLG